MTFTVKRKRNRKVLWMGEKWFSVTRFARTVRILLRIVV
jgi:hypothetical protein